MVPAPGLEPGRPLGLGILSPVRLPIPPSGHAGPYAMRPSHASGHHNNRGRTLRWAAVHAKRSGAELEQAILSQRLDGREIVEHDIVRPDRLAHRLVLDRVERQRQQRPAPGRHVRAGAVDDVGMGEDDRAGRPLGCCDAAGPRVLGDGPVIEAAQGIARRRCYIIL